MSDTQDLERLEEEGCALRKALAGVGDFRPGTLLARYRKCGSRGCHCARENDPGHGPKWVLVRSVEGKTRNWSIPEEVVEETKAQVAEYQRFRQLSGELVEVNERLCQERLSAREEAGLEAQKRGVLRQPLRGRSRRKSSD